LNHPVRLKSLKFCGTALFALMLLSVSGVGAAAQSKGYPRSYSDIVEAARSEGELIIYSTTDQSEIGSLLAMFRSEYPFIRLDYREMASSELYQKVISEAEFSDHPCDLVWSSAMDLQTKLVNDKYAQSYASPEKPFLPPWAIWKNEAYGITAEPVVIVYNEELLPAEDIPRSHRDLVRLLNSDSSRYRGKIATFDPEQSGLGYLTLTQDSLANPELWSLVRALGKVDVTLYQFSRDMLESVASGEHIIAYNVIGSYAHNLSKQYPQLKIVMPDDYTLVVSRIAVILSESRHPNAAKLFLDFLLSREGQNELASHFMSPVREDVSAEADLIPPRETLRPVHIGPTLLIYLDQIKREHFLDRWKRAIEVGRTERH
jgi:iron(III) transport system substrate-binding protein